MAHQDDKIGAKEVFDISAKANAIAGPCLIAGATLVANGIVAGWALIGAGAMAWVVE